MKLTEKKRESIIQAAIDEFREQGFLGAKTTRIAQRAGVSSRTLYRHFESKEALFDAISAIMVERCQSMKSIGYDPSQPLDAQLTAALHRYIALITDEATIGLTRLVISELLRDMERSRQLFAETCSHDYPMTRLVREAMQAGALRDADPVYATSQLLALVKNFYFWPEFFMDSKPQQEGLMEDCVVMFLSHYQPKA